MKNSPNYQPAKPTYFLVAGKGQLEFMNTSRLTTLKRDGGIPKNQPRFLSTSFGAQVRHMVACIGCDFIKDPGTVNDVYSMSSSPRGAIRFRKIAKGERDINGHDMIHYLQVTKTGRIFAILQR